MRQLKLLGFDPSMSNWGMAGALWHPTTTALTVTGLDVTQPVKPSGKQVRASSKDIEAGKQLFENALAACAGADAIFVEIPSGTKSVRGAIGNGMVFGVLGALRAQGLPIYEFTPKTVKVASHGSENASKADMIAWATAKHPEAPWPYYRGELNASKAEHMADALAAIYAGVQSNEFQQLLPILRRAA